MLDKEFTSGAYEAWIDDYIKHFYAQEEIVPSCFWCKGDHLVTENASCLEDFTNYWFYHRLDERFIKAPYFSKSYSSTLTLDNILLVQGDLRVFLAPLLRNTVKQAIRGIGHTVHLMGTNITLRKDLEYCGQQLYLKMSFAGQCFVCGKGYQIVNLKPLLYAGGFTPEDAIVLEGGPALEKHDLLNTEDEKYYFHLPCLIDYLKELK